MVLHVFCKKQLKELNVTSKQYKPTDVVIKRIKCNLKKHIKQLKGLNVIPKT